MEASVRTHASQMTILMLGLTWGLCAAQNTTSAGTNVNSSASVSLEAHNGQTHFKIGDPLIVDLVFVSQSPRYVVNTDTAPALPVSDLVQVMPKDGWVRSHSSFRGLAQNGSTLESLGSSSVRVPVLLNRTITFQEPGHYEITLTTERLHTSDALLNSTSLESCDRCRTTNALGIDLSERDQSEESALVVSLSRELEETKERVPGVELAQGQKEKILHELEALTKAADSTEASNEQTNALVRSLNDIESAQLAAVEKQEKARQEAAVRLAYLAGDDAVRAKVRFIVDEQDNGGAEPIGVILRDGLASSSNKQLQFSLLEAAWRDPHRVPTSETQAALHQAKELMHKQMVTNEGMFWGGTAEERRKALEEYEAEINEIIATLSLRSEANRAETIHFLEQLAVPNQFNKGQTAAARPD